MRACDDSDIEIAYWDIQGHDPDVCLCFLTTQTTFATMHLDGQAEKTMIGCIFYV